MTSTPLPQPPLKLKVQLPTRQSFLVNGVHHLELVLLYGHLEEHVFLVNIHGDMGLPPQNHETPPVDPIPVDINSSPPTPSNREEEEIVDSSGDDPLPSPPSREKSLIPTSSRFKRYFCSTCEKQFMSRRTLLQHLSSLHATQEEKDARKQGWKNKCYFCSRRFQSPSDLHRHLLIHTREKPHPCDKCRKQFNRKGDLARHQRLHDPDSATRRPFHCDKCEQSFTEKRNLTRHATTVHRRPLEEFQCGKCDGKFMEKSSLRKHLSGVHLGIRYPCHRPNCGKSFCQIGDLRGHEKKAH